MDQTLACIMLARNNQTERQRIEACLSANCDREIIVDRHRLTFHSSSQCVTITRASEEVSFAWKIGGCRMSYMLLAQLLNGDFENMESIEWLYGKSADSEKLNYPTKKPKGKDEAISKSPPQPAGAGVQK